MDYNAVLPDLLVGSYPENTADIDWLRRQEGVTAVLTLQTDEDLERMQLDWEQLRAHYRALGIEVCRVPVRDFDAEDLQRQLVDSVRILDRLLDQGHKVYVHCTAGMGRSPSVIIAYLHWVHGWDLEKAADHVSDCRPCCPNREAIRAAGAEWGEEKGTGS